MFSIIRNANLYGNQCSQPQSLLRISCLKQLFKSTSVIVQQCSTMSLYILHLFFCWFEHVSNGFNKKMICSFGSSLPRAPGREAFRQRTLPWRPVQSFRGGLSERTLNVAKGGLSFTVPSAILSLCSTMCEGDLNERTSSNANRVGGRLVKARQEWPFIHPVALEASES